MDPTAPRLLSRRMGVEWRGWRSDTQQLQRAGWQLAAEHDDYGHRIRLAMKHEGYKLFAVTSYLEFKHLYTHEPWKMYTGTDFPVFYVNTVLPIDFRICTYAPVGDLSALRAIDAEPRMVSHKVQTLDDFKIFAEVGKAEQVLVDRADMSVIEHLEAIKKLQSDKQRELRQKETKKPPNLIAQLVSYGDAA